MPDPIEVIFYVSNGPAYCPDCYALLGDEDKAWCRPVLADGTGDDRAGLICDCGAEWPPEVEA